MIRIFHQYPPRTLLLTVAVEQVLILLAVATCAAMVQAPWVDVASGAAWAAKVFAYALICQLGLHLGDFYDAWTTGRALAQRLFTGLGWALVLWAGLYWLAPGMRLGSARAILALPLIAALLWLWRQSLQRWGRDRGPRERVLLVGRLAQFSAVLDLVETRPELGVHIAGVVESVAELGQAVRAHPPDRVVVGPPAAGQRMPVAAIMPLERTRIVLEALDSFHASLSGRLPAGASNVLRGEQPSDADAPWLNQAVGGAALLLAAPLLALIALAVVLDSRGPVLYQQERIGRGGRRFLMLKFRSMRPDAEQSTGPVWARVADPRVTRVGRFLRASHLDELPQFWNVARGEMSLVGPRPERPAFAACLEAQLPQYRRRHSIRPGITGWAQVRSPYAGSVAAARIKLEHDLFYLDYASAGLGLFVLLQTVKTMFLGRGAR